MRFQPGNVLPLALIMTMTILMAGIGIGSVVLQGSQRSRESVDSIAAYYMADAGIERQLYEVRKNNLSVPALGALSANYSNGSFWKSTGLIEPISNKVFSSIAVNDFAVVDLFDPDNLGTPAGMTRLNIKWSVDPACGSTGVSTLEVSYSFWDFTTPKGPTDQSYVVLDKNSSGALDVSLLDPLHSYRVRIRAFGCAAKNVVVEAYRDAAKVDIPGDITLSAEGTYNKATQKIAVTMPKQDVLSGLFSFVIFSECKLVKGDGVPGCN